MGLKNLMQGWLSRREPEGGSQTRHHRAQARGLRRRSTCSPGTRCSLSCMPEAELLLKKQEQAEIQP
jgi:hypothetical protein